MTLNAATIEWRDGLPHSTQYDDIYFSADRDAEVERVFFTPSALRERMANEAQITIAELGFGSGRNFVNAAALASRHACRLHFISVELHPIPSEELSKILQPTEHEQIAEALIQSLPPLIPGWHQRHFCNNLVTLSLYQGSAADFINELTERHAYGVDAWFLDGFSPAKNPEMWQDDLLSKLGPLSRAGASIATFTSVGRVRRGLGAAGFEVHRVDQLPHKHESLAGRLAPNLGRDTADSGRTVQVVGAGIAGCSIAAHFANNGIDVVLTDTAAQLATGASSVVALQHARLLGDGSPQADWRAAAYHYATHWTRDRAGVHATGALQGVGPNLDEAKLERIAARYANTGTWLQRFTETQACARAEQHFSGPALYFPEAATVDLPVLCLDLATHNRIELRLGQSAPTELPVIYACGSATSTLPPFMELDIKPLWGQIDLVESASSPKIALLGDGYIAPFGQGAVIGSTYEYSPWEQEAATAHNFARAPHASTWIARRRGMRAVAADRTPICGQFNGHWLSTAHGSMGATSAHLAAAVIFDQFVGRIPPISAAVEAIIDPYRFQRRKEKRTRRAR